MHFPDALAVDLAHAIQRDPRNTPDAAALAVLVIMADAHRRRIAPRPRSSSDTAPAAVPLAATLPRVEATR